VTPLQHAERFFIFVLGVKKNVVLSLKDVISSPCYSKPLEYVPRNMINTATEVLFGQSSTVCRNSNLCDCTLGSMSEYAALIT
jgi:hypothetical protein